MIITAEFEGCNEKTTQHIMVNFDTNEERDKIVKMGMAEGMDSSLNRVDNYLSEIQ